MGHDQPPSSSDASFIAGTELFVDGGQAQI